MIERVVFLILGLCGRIEPLARHCDDATNSRFSEGNIGELGYFPWLGVLRVHLHDEDTVKIALTGLIYIKEKFTIANADDITRIPKHIFEGDSQAMFIPSDQTPWFCKVKEYMAHPEYEFATINTIALVELLPNEDQYFPMKPICVPGNSFNASDQLYAVGFTDDNKLLEKTLHKLQYVDQMLCLEFYNRAELSEGKVAPTSFQCGFAVNNKENCVWENGMAMISNSTGKWVLLGISIKGPGCAAPARFIELTTYIPWLESATSLEEVYYPDEARRAFSEDGVVDIPAHALFRSSNASPSGKPMLSDPYQIDVDEYAFLNVERIDKDAIVVARFDNKYETNKGDCSKYKMLVYRELTKLTAPGMQGTASFKLTLYDMMIMNYTCIRMKITAYNRTDAYIYYKKSINMYEGTAFGTFGNTPEDILLVHPIDKLETAPSKSNTTTPQVWKPDPHLEVKFLTDDSKILNIPNINLWVQFIFIDEAVITFEIHGKTFVPNVTFVRTTRRPRKKRTKKKKQNKKKNKKKDKKKVARPSGRRRNVVKTYLFDQPMALVRNSATLTTTMVFVKVLLIVNNVF